MKDEEVKTKGTKGNQNAQLPKRTSTNQRASGKRTAMSETEGSAAAAAVPLPSLAPSRNNLTAPPAPKRVRREAEKRPWAKGFAGTTRNTRAFFARLARKAEPRVRQVRNLFTKQQ